MKKYTQKHTKPGTEAIDGEFYHSVHGAPGSHDMSHKKLGGRRAAIEQGHPDEMLPSDGEGTKS